MDFSHELNRIFQGNNRGHGEFVIKAQKGPKATGQAKTVGTPPSEELWNKHLNGDIGLGVVPITENSTCSWGAVDIDEYEGLDLEDWSFKIPAPFVLCRSKSGGAHVYLFTQTPVPAPMLRKKLALLARAIGHTNAEIFPKQDQLNETDIGNWINMPYFAGEMTTRYCLKGGIALSIEEFISHVGECALSMQQLVDLKIDSIFESESDPEFEDAPPCLQYLIKHGFPVGSRNSALFSMGVFAKMKYGDNYPDKVFDYNNRFMSGTYSEVSGIIRSLNKKSYAYKCKDQPLLSVCDKETCLNCTYGVQLGRDDEKIRRPNVLDSVVKVKMYAPTKESKDEPYWVFEFEEGSLDITLDMKKSQALFGKEYDRVFYMTLLPIKDSKWNAAINALCNPKLNDDIEIHTLAPDAGPDGQMRNHLEEFCTNKAKAKVKEEILLGKPWESEGRIYFRSSDFMKYLDQQRFRAMKTDDIIKALKHRGAKHHDFNLKGKHVTCWSMPGFDEQTEPFDKDPLPEDEY